MCLKAIQCSYEPWSLRLRSLICSEMNTASITNKRLLQKERGSYELVFTLETVTFYYKNILQLII